MTLTLSPHLNRVLKHICLQSTFLYELVLDINLLKLCKHLYHHIGLIMRTFLSCIISPEFSVDFPFISWVLACEARRNIRRLRYIRAIISLYYIIIRAYYAYDGLWLCLCHAHGWLLVNSGQFQFSPGQFGPQGQFGPGQFGLLSGKFSPLLGQFSNLEGKWENRGRLCKKLPPPPLLVRQHWSGETACLFPMFPAYSLHESSNTWKAGCMGTVAI